MLTFDPLGVTTWKMRTRTRVKCGVSLMEVKVDLRKGQNIMHLMLLCLGDSAVLCQES